MGLERDGAVKIYFGKRWPKDGPGAGCNKLGLITLSWSKFGVEDGANLHLFCWQRRDWFFFDWEPMGAHCIASYQLGFLGAYVHI